MTKCDHKWVFIPGWVGCYRCDDCKSIGYRKFLSDEHTVIIVPYICSTYKCKRWAVGSINNVRYCTKHKKGLHDEDAGTELN